MTRQTAADANQIQLKGRRRTAAARQAANAIIHLRFAHSGAEENEVFAALAEGAGVLSLGCRIIAAPDGSAPSRQKLHARTSTACGYAAS